MASICQHASSSALSYEVFLNFHGKDVRTTFADHLYHALVEAGIRTFRDDKELNKGEELAPNLLAAIQQSIISIPILSMNYASSKWCLNELKEISKCKRTRNQIVLPVFYKIEPTDVRNQTGGYAKAFDEEHPKHFDQAIVKMWRDVLQEIGKLDGWHLKEDVHEGKIVKEIMKSVSSKLNKRLVHVSHNLVGMKAHIVKMLELLDDKSDVTKIVGIHGFGGIGKTTISRVVCNTILNEFEEYAFIENVREDARKYGIHSLQKKLITGILKYGSPNFIDVDTGVKVIQQRLCEKKVLVVLDDVDEDIQIESLIGDGEWFGIGSKIIITSRDKNILTSRRARIYEPHVMNVDDSLELFCRYAFKMDRPQVDYLDLSKALVKTTGGLPLALKVIGSSLFSKKKPIWESMLKKLQKVPNNDVMERLKISYDELEYSEQQMFLDAACFFIGSNKDSVCYIWEGCDFYPQIGLDVLCAKSLITINEDNVLGMHDVLRNLGRDIVRRESTKPGERSRIWSKDEVLDVLVKKKGTNKCVGLTIDLFKSESKDRCLRSEGLDAMTELRLLQLDYAQILGNCNNSFSELRWLSWEGCLETDALTNFCPEKLVVLDLSNSQITKSWRGWNCIKMAANLKVLKLEFCRQLCSIPNLSENQLLELLSLKGCDKLTGIDTPIGKLMNLVNLHLKDCKSLVDLPIEFFELASLETLNLDGCVSLRKLSDKLEQMISLRTLSLSCDDDVLCLPSCLGRLRLNGCDSLGNLQSLPPSLIVLSVQNCSSIRYISGLPSSLKHLDVSNCNSVVEISTASSGSLRNLKTLDLLNCRSLEEIGDIGKNLDSLVKCRISGCESLKRLPKLSCSKNLSSLEIYGVGVSSRFSGEGMDSLEELKITECNSLENIPYLRDSKRLREIYIWHCLELTEIEHVGGYESLQILHIFEAPSLKTLPEDISALKNLRDLRIESCELMESLPNLSNLKQFRILNIIDCNKLSKIRGLHGLEALQDLKIEKCENLTEIHGVESLKSLKTLLIKDCCSLEISLDLSNFKNLEVVMFKGCNNLTEIHGVERLKSLKILWIEECCSLETSLDLSNFKNLEKLSIKGCKNIPDHEHPEGWTIHWPY